MVLAVVWRVALLSIVLIGVPAPYAAAGPEERCLFSCRDGNPCTVDICTRSGCVHLPANGSACDDGDPCTGNDRCRAGHCQGTLRSCDDGLACTADSCADGEGCVHQPRDAICGGAECSSGTCRPGDLGADARGCVIEPASDGTPCSDDGVACTEDSCEGGVCRHPPRDERCSGEHECRVLTCAPASEETDEQGCAVASVVPSGEECIEDDEPCTDDVCHAGLCAHEPIADVTGCAPVREPYRQARELLARARVLGRALAAAVDARAASDGQFVSPLRDVEDDLERAARALAGKWDAPTLPDERRHEVTSQQRARVAASILQRTPGRLTGALRRARRSVPASSVSVLQGEGRELRRGTRALRSSLRRMTRVTGTFVR